MKKYITKTLIFFKLSLLSFAFTGCGQESKLKSTDKKRATVVAATSISYTNDNKEPLNAHKIEELNQNLSLIISHQLEVINNKEATLFTEVTEYCEQTGHKEILNRGEVSTHTEEITFEHCQDDHTLQEGGITLSYNYADDDGKFPQVLEINVDKNYHFNNLELSKNSHITVNNIHYNEEQHPDSLELMISGEVYIGDEQYSMQNFQQRVRL